MGGTKALPEALTLHLDSVTWPLHPNTIRAMHTMQQNIRMVRLRNPQSNHMRCRTSEGSTLSLHPMPHIRCYTAEGAYIRCHTSDALSAMASHAHPHKPMFPTSHAAARSAS